MLLAGAILSTVTFGVNVEAVATKLALTATASYLAVLAASLITLIPLQKRILASPGKSEDMQAMRHTWQAGHIGRPVLSVIAFGLAASAAYL